MPRNNLTVYIILFLNISNALIFTAHYELYGDFNETSLPSYRLWNSNSSEGKLHKRSTTSALNITTRSFVILLECQSPFGDEKGETCKKVSDSFRRVANRIERVLFLSNPVTIKASFLSLCNTNITDYGKPCAIDETTLGFAASKEWHQFETSSAIRFGLDPDYIYPTSLARQYAGNTSELDPFDIDVDATFNSDWNWWFSNSDDQAGYSSNSYWGPPVAINGGFYKQTDTYSYDFEQVVAHEIIHGLGFTSSWKQIQSDPSFYIPNVNFSY